MGEAVSFDVDGGEEVVGERGYRAKDRVVVKSTRGFFECTAGDLISHLRSSQVNGRAWKDLSIKILRRITLTHPSINRQTKSQKRKWYSQLFPVLPQRPP